jgi:tetratricopeptide (TPR) repeat protein
MNESVVQEHASLESLVGRVADEFLRRQEQGERPDIEEYAARYPQAAPILRKVLAALGLLEQSLAEPAAPAGTASETLPAGILGDFRILREIGRGGMGVVYEAQQISLKRRVALKVLPFAAVLDPRQLQRFQNEAQTAACLHHTNIVPVFTVGCERGVHYFAMQYIEGEPLDRVIQDLRRQQRVHSASKEKGPRNQPTTAHSPAPPASAPPSAETVQPVQAALSTEQSITSRGFFQSVARLGIQAAEGLDHAHQQGILHRDIKPANLLLDVRGNLWIADFGLARFQNDTRLSMTGDLVGTLRYMSPEQALAKRVVVDHRTDIYSLSVTLYELLTLEPAFSGGDREEVLRQIAFEEPRSPRRLNKFIPAELETIVLKGMEKNPAERYATAQQLADDLRRFLEDRPIHAKRPTLAERAAKWSRRHKSAMKAAAAILILAVVGLAASTGLIWRANEQTKSALADAKANAERAQRNLDTGFKILDEIYVDTAEKRLPRNKDLTAEDREFLEKALSFYEQFASQESSDSRVRQRTVDAYLRVGAIQEWLGKEAKAAKTYEDALAVASQLAAEFPGDPDCRQKLARSYASLGGHDATMLGLESRPKMEQALVEALRLQEQLVNEFPENRDYQWDLGLTYYRLGHMRMDFSGSQRRLLIEAEEPVRRALAIREKLVRQDPTVFLYRKELGMSLGNLGNILTFAGRYQEAGEVQRRELEVRQKLAEDFPAEPESHHYLADAYADLCELRSATGQHQEAEQALRKELTLWQKLATDFPGVPHYPARLAHCHLKLGKVLGDQVAVDESKAAYQEFIRLSPDKPIAYNNLGKYLGGNGSWDGASAAFKEAVWLMPDEAEFHINLAIALAQKGSLDEAIAAYKEAIHLQPDDAQLRNFLGVALWKKGASDEAIAAYTEAIRLQPNVARYRNNLASALAQKGSLDEAIAAIREAIHLRPDDACSYDELAVLLDRKGALDEALNASREAIRLEPGNAIYHKNRGIILSHKGAVNEAIAAYKEAIRLQPDNAKAYDSLGLELREKAALDEAVAAHQEAVRLEARSALFHVHLGYAYESQDALDKAIACYKEALSLEPDSATTALNDLAKALIEKGALDEADVVLTRATPIFEKRAKDRPEEVVNRLHWGSHLVTLAALHRDTARSQEADMELRQAQAVLEKLVNEFPNYWFLHHLAFALSARAKLCRDRGELAEARRLFSEALARRKKAMELGGKSSPFFRGRVVIHSLELADTLLQLPPDPALTVQVEELLREAVRWSAGDRSAQNALAWFLANSPEPHFRDPKRAVELAKRLVEQGPQRAAYWRTLGAALHGMENWKGAVAAMEKAMEVCNGGDGTERFFIAMACWRMGKKEEARASYEQAVQWMETHRPQHYELRRFRVEAVDLLGIKHSPAALRELLGPPKPVDDDTHSSLDLVDRSARVAGNEALPLAVHEQIQAFEDHGPDQGAVAFRFDNRVEDTVPAQKLDIDRFGPRTPGAAPIGVTNAERVLQCQPQLVGHRFGQHEHGSTRVHPAGDGLSPDLLGGQKAAPSQRHIVVVGNLEIDGNASHAVSSFRAHAGAPFAHGSRMQADDCIIRCRTFAINQAVNGMGFV